MSPAPDPGFEALARRIAGTAGLSVAAYKDKCLRRRIAVRMRACGVHTYTDYLTVLDRTPAEYDRLLDALTINVTRFFRNPETWTALRDRALGALWQERQGRLVAWSAGCASGEEPYTIAMLVAELCRERSHPAWLERLQVDATDIDRGSLDRTRAARYRPEAFAETPPELVRRYTVEREDGEREIVPALRARVRATSLDFTTQGPLRPRYDLICCRNVVIYFDRPMQERLFLSFVEALAPDGILLLGKVETLVGPARDRLVLLDPRERIYRPAS